MSDEMAARATAFLQPGEFITSEGPMRVKTVVGSCLAIMMRAPRLGLAVIAHCLLPEAGVSLPAISREQALRYVDTSIDLLLRALSSRGASNHEIEIKLFGGADALGGLDTERGYRIGSRNVDAARAALAARGLTVLASGVGGNRGRAIEFDTGTGEVLVRKLPPQRPVPGTERP